MNDSNRVMKSGLFVLAMVTLLVAPTAGATDETAKEYLTAAEYIEIARPFLHLSCEGAWQEADMEADPYIEIINKVSAIGFLNHELDIEEVYNRPAEDVEALRVEFYNEIGRLCGENPHRLLAGVVERALMKSFMKIAPEAVDDFEE